MTRPEKIGRESTNPRKEKGRGGEAVSEREETQKRTNCSGNPREKIGHKNGATC